MPLGLTDLDPDMARVLREALLELPQTKGRPSVAMRGKDWLVPCLPAFSIGGACTLILGPFLYSTLPSWPVITLTIIGGLTIMGVGLQNFSKEAEKLNTRRGELFFTSELLQQLPSTLPLSAPQRTYLESVHVLLVLQTRLGEEPIRELLSTLNGLLAAAVQLEQERARFSGQSIDVLTAERAAAQQRLQQTTDLSARQTRVENLAMIERQWLHARAEAPVRERIEAQWEGALHSLRTVQQLLVGLQAPSQSAEALLALHDEVRKLRTRTRAVEAAIQEVGL